MIQLGASIRAIYLEAAESTESRMRPPSLLVVAVLCGCAAPKPLTPPLPAMSPFALDQVGTGLYAACAPFCAARTIKTQPSAAGGESR